MTKLYNAKDYVEAKKMLTELKIAARTIKNTVKSLEPFLKYKPVYLCVQGVIDWYPVLKHSIKEYEIIVKNKGKQDE